MNDILETLQILHKHLLGLNVKLIKIWWSKVKGHSGLSKDAFAPNSKARVVSKTNF